MKDLTTRFLGDSEREKIINAVKEVEKITSGEIVPMAVSSSYHYPVSNIIGGLAFSFPLSIGATYLMGTESMWVFLGVMSPFFIIMHEFVKRCYRLKRLFISDREINEEVEEAAVKAFYHNGLYKTRDNTGVLIFISVFERKVWVLADKGINEKVAPGTWQEIVAMIIDGIKKKEQCDAIVRAIGRVGDILKKHFPVRAGDTDELKNLIVEK